MNELPVREPAFGSATYLLAQRYLKESHGRLKRFFHSGPFLAVSLLLHTLVLFVLAFVTMRQTGMLGGPERLKIEELDEMILAIPVAPPANGRDGDEEGGGGLFAGLGGPGEMAEDVIGDCDPVTVRKLAVLTLEAPVGFGTEGAWARRADGAPFDLTEPGGPGADAVVDRFAVITIDHMKSGRTLVALLLDRSASVIYRDVQLVRARLERYFSEVDRNLPKTLEEAGAWVVVSYAAEPKFECPPTVDKAYLQHVMRNVPADGSGVENVGRAIKTVLDRYEGKGYKHILIAAITDEAGDDVEDPKVLEPLVARLYKNEAKFYVLGHEATFCTRSKYVQFPATNLEGQHRAMYQAHADANGKKLEDIVIAGWAHGGPDCPRPELWWTTSWHDWNHWGGHLHNIPSGLGMYALSRMVSASEGAYLLLSQESDYDMDKMVGGYRPDICSVGKYDELMAKEPIRGALHATWSELGVFHLAYDLRNPKQVSEMLERSETGRDYCAMRIGEIQRILATRPAGGPNAQRWRAHADVTVAELMRYRFMLGQYNEVLRRGWHELGGKVSKDKRLLMVRGRAPQDFVGPDEARREYDAARQYIQLAIERHKGTPWAEIAQRLHRALYPWRCMLADVPVPPPTPVHRLEEPLEL